MTTLVRPSDWDVCRDILARGSRSFSLAARALPEQARDPAAALYAFCRVADDLVDDGGDPRAAVGVLEERLDRIYRGAPDDDPVHRAFGGVVATHALPRTLFDALVEGFAWDAERRRYDTLDELLGYAARVASTVGVAMTLLMGRRSVHTLARAADLGIAMQLTNIARDVGEDARAGRLYLPRAWLVEASVDPEAFVAEPRPSAGVAQVVERVLAVAAEYYQRADVGIAELPWRTRWAIRAARLVYADIGRVIAARGYDSVSQRAVVSGARKRWLLVRASRALVWCPRAQIELPPATPVRFLIEAAA